MSRNRREISNTKNRAKQRFESVKTSKKMVTSCVAYKCHRRSNQKSKDDGITFHRIPIRDKKLRDVWIKSLRRQNWEPSQTAQLYLCSEHFKDEDYKVI